MTPLVSIIIPCYNGEKFINRSLSSIFNQTYKKIQIIFIDDGSTDNTKKEISKWINKALKTDNISLDYIYQNNSGPAKAIKIGLNHIKGKYLSLLDVDDMLLPESISKRVEFLEKHSEFSIVRTNGYIVDDENLCDTSRTFVVNEAEKQNQNIFEDLIKGTTNNWAGSYMVRCDELLNFYKENEFFDSRYGQNLQILLPVAYKSKSGFIDEPLMLYIRQKKSLSKDDSNLELSYQKQATNQKGYLQIKKHLIITIVENSLQNKYFEIANEAYNHMMFTIALSCKNNHELKKYYDKLILNKQLTKEEKILYLKVQEGFKNKCRYIFERIKNKIIKRF